VGCLAHCKYEYFPARRFRTDTTEENVTARPSADGFWFGGLKFPDRRWGRPARWIATGPASGDFFVGGGRKLCVRGGSHSRQTSPRSVDLWAGRGLWTFVHADTFPFLQSLLDGRRCNCRRRRARRFVDLASANPHASTQDRKLRTAALEDRVFVCPFLLSLYFLPSFSRNSSVELAIRVKWHKGAGADSESALHVGARCPLVVRSLGREGPKSGVA